MSSSSSNINEIPITSIFELEMEKSKIHEQIEKLIQLILASKINDTWKDAAIQDQREIATALDSEFDEQIKTIRDKETRVGAN